MSRDILVSLIDPDPGQPRKHFDTEGIAELAQSMAASGLAVPILLRPVGERFLIVHGERRWRAACTLAWPTIAADVRDVTPEEARWLALIENVQRADLSPIEEAEAYQAALSSGITQTELGRRVGKTQSYIATKLRFLKLAPLAKEGLSRGAITEGHAKQLLRLESGDKQSELFERCSGERWTVERTRIEVDALLNATTNAQPTTPAEYVRWVFHNAHRGVPQHDPYPEDRLADMKPPIAVKRLPLASLIEHPDTDSRLDRDPGYAVWLAEVFDCLPPIAVHRVNGEYIVTDGRYRIMAARLLGRQEIDCRIYEAGSLADAVLYSCAANACNGGALTKEELQSALNRGCGASLVHSQPCELAPAESDDLARCEATIERGLGELRHLGIDLDTLLDGLGRMTQR